MEDKRVRFHTSLKESTLYALRIKVANSKKFKNINDLLDLLVNEFLDNVDEYGNINLKGDSGLINKIEESSVKEFHEEEVGNRLESLDNLMKGFSL
ncbi:MAG: hypothetical protein LBV08_08155 [Clostridiales bacterium]|jgi:hypothetical protein|nr:hypothetical protein [Clostridiales bacterium]